MLEVPIPCTQMADTFCWGLFGSGEFSTRSATWKAHASFLPVNHLGSLNGFGNWISCLKLRVFYGNYVIIAYLLEAFCSIKVYF